MTLGTAGRSGPGTAAVGGAYHEEVEQSPSPDQVPAPGAALPVDPVAVRDALRGVIDPELGDNIVDLGMVDGVDVSEAGAVVVRVALTTPSCPLRGQIKAEVMARVGALPGVGGIDVVTTAMLPEQKAALMARARWKASERAPKTTVPPRARVLAVSSGKGGVGKSSVSVNLAAGLAARGYTVGVLDADIAGFSVPRMLGVSGQLETTKAPGQGGRNLIQPLVRRVANGELRIVSMGFLAGEDEAVMWRGLMLNRAVQHFLEDVAWGDIDYLVVDMPPGDGRHTDGTGSHAAQRGGPGCHHPEPERERWQLGPPPWPARATCGSSASSRT